MKKTTLPANLRGKYVSRAAFAKLQAENHRLKKDIHTMVTGSIPDVIFVKEIYRKEFQFWKDIQDGLREIAKKELPALKAKYGIKDLTDAKLDSNPKAFK